MFIPYLYLTADLSICRYISRMIGGSAGRQINRIRTKYRSVSIYIIYWYAMYVYSECEVDL